MNAALGSRNYFRLFQQVNSRRRCNVTFLPAANFSVAGIVNYSLNPQFQIQACVNKDIGVSQCSDKRWFGPDEVRILVTADDSLDADTVPANKPYNKGIIRQCRHDLQFSFLSF